MKTNPGEKHGNLPRGTDLHNSNLRRELLVIFTKLDVSKLAKLDSSNVNESFNNTLRSKAPKDKHYCESNSLQDRLAAAVCQKNDGYGYVFKVNHGQYIFTYKLQMNIMSHFRSKLHHHQTFSRDPRMKLLIWHAYTCTASETISNVTKVKAFVILILAFNPKIAVCFLIHIYLPCLELASASNIA